MEWRTAIESVGYLEAETVMAERVSALQQGKAEEMVWLLEHPALYTAGISAKPEDLLESRFPVFPTKRGGQYTYHGQGQRIAYVMMDLKQRDRDVRQYVADLQAWVIDALAVVGVHAFCRKGRVGLWVHRNLQENDQGYEDKIAAIGVRVQKWISSHGVSVNINPDLSHFSAIVPCGISDQKLGVTSLEALGISVSQPEFDEILKNSFHKIFCEKKS